MIKPTIGRVVHYRPSDYDLAADEGGMETYSDQPLTALIVYVWSDTCINLVVFDHRGKTFARTSVPINTQGASPSAEWMPYQVGQAAALGRPQLVTGITSDGKTVTGQTLPQPI